MTFGGGALTPAFVMDLETRMRVISANEYQRLLADLWYTRVIKEIPSGNRRELLFWLLDTATIEATEEGNITFEDLVMQNTEFTPEFSAKGLQVLKSKFEDLENGVQGGMGISLATAWSRQIGAQMAYWPQAKVAEAIVNGTSKTGYDGVNFFATNHPLNPFDSSLGTYSNLYTDSTSTGGTVGVKLDDRHSLDTCFKSFAEIRNALHKIKMPNGTQPRKLRPLFFLAPPRMMDRLALLTAAKFIGSADTSGGSTDVSEMRQIARWGLQAPVECDELSAAFGGSDTDCYLVTQQIADQEMGPLVYVNREPYAIRYYSGDSTDGAAVGLDAVLNRARQLEWHVQGRNVVGYGHPYLIHKLVGQAP